MRPQKVDDRWVIATNFRWMETNGITASRSRRSRGRQTFDCWDGEKWWHQLSSAMRFQSEEETLLYIEANREKLEA
jgi:hypothetical protein